MAKLGHFFLSVSADPEDVSLEVIGLVSCSRRRLVGLLVAGMK